LRNAFTAFAEMHRVPFEVAPGVAGTADMSGVESDLRILREWNTTNDGDCDYSIGVAVGRCLL